MKAKSIHGLLALALLAACGPAKVAEVGPYTVSVIEKNVYHIQDSNSAYPPGQSVDAEGRPRFNNCSDMYLLVGRQKALLIDLSNAITWADNAAESLRTLVGERTAGKPLTITFTHNHGDHTGMLPAWIDDPEVHFALPRKDFARMAERFPEAQRSLYDEGEIFDLGGLQLEAIEVPGHTAGSVVFLLQGHDLLFSGDAVGSGSGVWIFNADGFAQYVSGVPHLLEALEERGVSEERLQVFGGHFHQNPKGNALDMKYLRDMEVLCGRIENGTAASEPSGQRRGLETNFRYGDAVVTWSAEQAEQFRLRQGQN
ncbi:MAG: MBL fold metallo-hydrolase [Bacteroidales bacterium]|jgi:hydroxyacylglutathione hydrolase|nr:MBL fold metallo-hydrolase [Bacteroidales bacterium]